MALVDIRNLSVEFPGHAGTIRAVVEANLFIRPGEILGIAGESGSGKTTLCNSIVRTLPKTARISGDIRFENLAINELSDRELRRIRGRDISMILQNPMTSLDPLFSIGNQIGEVLHRRGETDRKHVTAKALELLRSVHMTAPAERLRQFPHELSGGMRQRVLIAMASVMSPKLLLADEPTTALDATVQEEILVLFREIRDRYNTAIVVVTHDLGVIRRICDRIVIMYAGRIVEDGPVEAVFRRPRHPYTRALLDSVPRLEGNDVFLQAIPGQVPNLVDLGDHCAFSDRCPLATDQCRSEYPDESGAAEGHRVFCFRPGAAQ
jgi:peptide/nickel transport system ATP-binding protein